MCVHSRLALLVEAWLIDTGSSASLLSTFRLTPEQEALQRTLPRGAIVGGLYLDAPREHVFNPGSAPAVGAWLNDLESAMRLLREVAGGLPVVVVVLPSRFHIDAALRGKVLLSLVHRNTLYNRYFFYLYISNKSHYCVRAT